MYKTLLILTAAILTLSACSGGKAPQSLEGTTWELVTMDEQFPLTGSSITLSFEDGQMGGSAGCNSYGGSYEVDGDSIKPGELMSTMMYCQAEGVMDQETAYLNFLSKVRSYAIIDGTLYLSQPDGRQLAFIPLE
jgi:heat shock protein HslJ